MVKTRAESAYAHLMGVHADYMEAVAVLQSLVRCAEAHEAGHKVDWKGLGEQAARLRCLQEEKL